MRRRRACPCSSGPPGRRTPSTRRRRTRKFRGRGSLPWEHDGMAAPEERIRIETARGDVSGAWAGTPDAIATLVVAHGAGAGMDHPFLAGFTRELNARLVATLRFNFLYAERGRRSPDPEPGLRDAWLA